MAIKGNSSEVKVVGESRKLFTGLCNVTVLAVNPSKAELEEIGIKTQNEPVYSKEENGVTKTKLDFIIVNAASGVRPTKLTFFLEDKKVVSKAGNKQYINALGRSTWAASPDNFPSFFKGETAREAYAGEVMLHEFIEAWVNIKTGDECKLDTMASIVKGNVAELKSLVKSFINNEVKVLLGVREYDGNHYQDVYNKYFGRAYQESLTYWVKQLNDEYGQFKSNWQYDFEFKEFVPGVVVADATETTASVDSTSPF